MTEIKAVMAAGLPRQAFVVDKEWVTEVMVKLARGKSEPRVVKSHGAARKGQATFVQNHALSKTITDDRMCIIHVDSVRVCLQFEGM